MKPEDARRVIDRHTQQLKARERRPKGVGDQLFAAFAESGAVVHEPAAPARARDKRGRDER